MDVVEAMRYSLTNFARLCFVALPLVAACTVGTTACFNFTLTYPGAQLYAAAYTYFDPTNLASGYLGDVGDALSSPQTMGISVAAGATIEVVVYAIANGTAAAGSYTLSCATQ